MTTTFEAKNIEIALSTENIKSLTKELGLEKELSNLILERLTTAMSNSIRIEFATQINTNIKAICNKKLIVDTQLTDEITSAIHKQLTELIQQEFAKINVAEYLDLKLKSMLSTKLNTYISNTYAKAIDAKINDLISKL